MVVDSKILDMNKLWADQTTTAIFVPLDLLFYSSSVELT